MCVGLATFQAQVPLKSPTSFPLLESLLKLDLGVVIFKQRGNTGFAELVSAKLATIGVLCSHENRVGRWVCRLTNSKLKTGASHQVHSCHICLNATYQKASFKGLSGLVHLLLEKSWGHQVTKLFFLRTSWNFDEFQHHAVLLQQGLVWSSCPVASCPFWVVQLQPTVGLTPCRAGK